MTGWVKWEDQKPKDGQRYLVFHDGRYAYPYDGQEIVLAEYDGDYRDGGGMWYWNAGESGYYGDPCRTYRGARGTYWAELPKPPK